MKATYMYFALFLSSFVVAEEPSSAEVAHEFTADISKMMKIIINSLYSNKDIFLRELISNCADAMNKVRVQAHSNASILGTGDDARLDIRILPDEDDQTIAIIDRGIGMNKTELITNLGTIAHSGTQKFLDGVGQNQSAVDLIGQFGVGFYSSFLVADKVVVTSKRFDDKQYIWTSNNAQSFDVIEDTNGPSLFRGTKVLLHLRDPQYANATLIKELALHYSEFVDFPIYVRMEAGQAGNTYDVEDDDYDDKRAQDDDFKLDPIPSYTKNGHRYDFVQINRKKAIWLRDPAKINKTEYIEFFRSITRDYNETPLTWTHYNDMDKNGSEFRSILFIPQEVPDMEMTANRKFQSLKLYVHRVLITEEFDDFIPRYLSWIRGVIDSDDLQLNVSRELLQESKRLRQIGRKIVKRILKLLQEMAEKRDNGEDPLYDDFYSKYSRYLKLGILEDSSNKKKLARLLRFNSTRSPDKAISLDDYVAHMKPDQTDFFYIAGDTVNQNYSRSPFLIPYLKRNIEVLFFTEALDEAVVRELKEYDHKIFTCITQSDRLQVRTESELEKETLRKWRKRFKPLVAFFQEALGDRIVRAEVSSRLSADPRAPCVLSHQSGSASANMEKYSHRQHRSDPRYAVRESKKVLEINPTNQLIKRMQVAVEMLEAQQLDGPAEGTDKELGEAQLLDAKLKLETIALLLYDTAVFESGFVVGDMNEYAERVFDVLTRMTGLPTAPVEEEEDIVAQVLREEEELEMEKEEEEEKKRQREADRKKEAEQRRKAADEEEQKESEEEAKKEKAESKKKDSEKEDKKAKAQKKPTDDDDDDDE